MQVGRINRPISAYKHPCPRLSVRPPARLSRRGTHLTMRSTEGSEFLESILSMILAPSKLGVLSSKCLCAWDRREWGSVA